MVRGVAITVAALAALDILRRLWFRGRRLYSWAYLLESFALGASIALIFSDVPTEALPEAVLVGILWTIGTFVFDWVFWYRVDKRSPDTFG